VWGQGDDGKAALGGLRQQVEQAALRLDGLREFAAGDFGNNICLLPRVLMDGRIDAGVSEEFFELRIFNALIVLRAGITERR